MNDYHNENNSPPFKESTYKERAKASLLVFAEQGGEERRGEERTERREITKGIAKGRGSDTNITVKLYQNQQPSKEERTERSEVTKGVPEGQGSDAKITKEPYNNITLQTT